MSASIDDRLKMAKHETMHTSEKVTHNLNKYREWVNSFDDDFREIRTSALLLLNNDCTNHAGVLHELATLVDNGLKSARQLTTTEKAEVSKQLMGLFANTAASGSYELSAALRNIVQKNSNLFESNYGNKLNLFYKPVIGAIWKDIDHWVCSITRLQETHRSQDIQLSVPRETIEDFLLRLRNRILENCAEDMALLYDHIRLVREEAGQLLQPVIGKGLASAPPVVVYAAKADQLITSCLRIETPYQGSYPRKNFRSFIFEMRSFSMMFLLILSSFGINKYIAKNEQAKTIVFIISMTLVAIGILNTFANSHDSKIDKEEDELNKARQKIYAELKRSLNECMADWKTYVLGVFRYAMADITDEADQLIREDSKQKTDDLAAEKSRLNNLSQQLEARDRKLQELVRKSEVLKLQATEAISTFQAKLPSSAIN